MSTQLTDLRTLHFTEAITCHPTEQIERVAAILRDSGAGSVVVVDDHEHLVGIVTDRDIVIRAVATGLPLNRPVQTVMTSDVGYVYASEDVATATTRMLERRCRRLPVLDTAGAVVGVVALDDLLQVFARQVEMLATVVGQSTAWERVIDVDRVP